MELKRIGAAKENNREQLHYYTSFKKNHWGLIGCILELRLWSRWVSTLEHISSCSNPKEELCDHGKLASEVFVLFSTTLEWHQIARCQRHASLPTNHSNICSSPMRLSRSSWDMVKSLGAYTGDLDSQNGCSKIMMWSNARTRLKAVCWLTGRLQVVWMSFWGRKTGGKVRAKSCNIVLDAITSK